MVSDESTNLISSLVQGRRVSKVKSTLFTFIISNDTFFVQDTSSFRGDSPTVNPTTYLLYFSEKYDTFYLITEVVSISVWVEVLDNYTLECTIFP